MKDSGVEWIGEIPEGWEVTSLKRLVKKITDGEHISPKFTLSGMPFLSAKDMFDDKILQWFSFDLANQAGRFALEAQ